MALFDLIQSAMGRPDPAMQIARAFGQAPGQPGSPQGPQPLAGAAPPGPPAGQGGAPGASDAPPGPPQAPPQPQATQTPPDLGQMFVQLMQRQQASEGFNRGLGMLAAGFAQPRDRAAMIDAMSGQSGDAAGVMGNLMKLQQWNIQQQRYGDMQKNLPAIAEAMKLPLTAVQTMFASNPEAFGSEIAKIQEAQMGLTGNPAQKELIDARRAWHDANPGKSDTDMIGARPELGSLAEFVPAMAEKSKLATDRGADIAEAQSKFGDLQGTSTDFLGKLGQLSADPNLGKITGMNVDPATIAALPVSEQKKYFGGPDGYALKQLVDNLQGQAYAANFGHGQGRLSTQEASKLLEGRSQLGKLAMDTDTYRQQAISPLIVQTMRVMADNYGAAGKTDQMPGYLNPYLSSIYTKGGQYYTATGPHVVAPTAGAKPMAASDLAEAQKQIELYGPQAVLKHLRDNGYDTSQLE